MDSGANIVQILLSFVFVLALIGVFAMGLRKFGRAEKWFAKTRTDARIKMVETCYIDPRRKLVLIKRDDVEHLLLIAPDTQVVVEPNIRSGMK